MAITFTDKQNLELTAARCVGMIRAIFNDVLFDGTNAQTLLETEYVALYSQLQDLCFKKNGDIRWLLPNEMEQLPGITVYKTDLGIGVDLYNNLKIEVASKIEARVTGDAEVFEFPSVIRAKMKAAA